MRASTVLMHLGAVGFAGSGLGLFVALACGSGPVAAFAFGALFVSGALIVCGYAEDVGE